MPFLRQMQNGCSSLRASASRFILADWLARTICMRASLACLSSMSSSSDFLASAEASFFAFS